MKIPNLVIIGPGRHGKDTAAEYLANTYGLRAPSPWDAGLAEMVLPLMRATFGCKTAEDVKRIRHSIGYSAVGDPTQDFSPLHEVNMRAVLYEAITLTGHERAYDTVMANSDVYIGARRIGELMYVKSKGAKVIWVDAYDRIPEREGSDSMELTVDEADFIIDNSGTPQEMYDQLDALMQNHFGLLPIEGTEV